MKEPSLLHHLPHALPSFLVGDADEINACEQGGHVDVEFIALALHAEYPLPEHVEHLGLLKVLAGDSDEAGGRVGMDDGKGVVGFAVFLNA